jgi:hypothetical protein
LNSSEARSALAAYVNSVFNIGSTQIWIGDSAIRIFGPNLDGRSLRQIGQVDIQDLGEVLWNGPPLLPAL